MFVRDRMTPDPICGHPDMPVTAAQAMMHQKGIRHLPIRDDNNRLVGLVTHRSLARALPSGMSHFSQFEINYVLAKIKVREIMAQELITTDEDTAIEEAARIMADNKIGCLPVMQDGELAGIITDSDIFRLMLDLLGARRSGLRVTVIQPDRVGAVASLSTAIAQAGGNMSGFVTYPSADPSLWSFVLKIKNMSREDVAAVIGQLGDVQIVDIREV